MSNIEEDSVYAIKFAVMQQQINEKDKRIKELEEKNKTLKNFTSSIFNGDVTKDFIPVQKVKDLIKNETINISGFECIAVEDIEELMEDK